MSQSEDKAQADQQAQQEPSSNVDPKATHIAVQWKHDRPLINCRFDPQARFIFATSEDRTIQRWEIASGTKVGMSGHDSWARGIAFSKDGETMITSGYDDTLVWWKTADAEPKPVNSIQAHKGWIRAISVSPDGTLLASGGNDKVVRIWNLADGTPVREMTGHEKDIYSVQFHPAGEFLLTGDLAGQVKQWDVSTGALVANFDGKALHTYNGGQRVDYGGVRSISFSPDLKTMACSGLHKASNPLGAVNEPLVLLFDWETREVKKSLVGEGTKGINWRTVYHPDGFLIGASGGSGGGFLIFWKPEEEKEFHKFKLPDTAREMDLHPDNIQIATVHYDKHLRISKMIPKMEEKKS
jgi:WD40 repeat protein